MDPSRERYAKQILFSGIGDTGQNKLASKSVLLCGCGALGTVVADQLVRAGVGRITIVDRDFVELSNLQRQILYDEQDVAERLPKAVAATNKLRKINSSIEIEPVVADIDRENILKLAAGADLILDGTDNFEVRFLINDASLELDIPWIYTGCIGSHGQVMPIIPGKTACLRCLMEDVPEPGSIETCDTAGVLGPAVNVISSLEVILALKMLTEQWQRVKSVLTIVDVWENTFREMKLGNLRENSNCPACKAGKRDWLHGTRGSQSTILCGRNAVQVVPERKGALSLDELASRLESSGTLSRNAYLLKFEPAGEPFELTVFRDGRAIIKGTEEIPEARTIYAKYVGT